MQTVATVVTGRIDLVRHVAPDIAAACMTYCLAFWLAFQV
jgi:hypothetical protein